MENFIDEQRKFINSKQVWRKDEVFNIYNKLEKIFQEHYKMLVEEDKTKKEEELKSKLYGIMEVDKIEKYDIILMKLFDKVNHAFLVYKVTKEHCYAFCLSSKNKEFAIHEIQKDKVLKGGFVTITMHCFNIEEAKKKYIRKYNSKSEADSIFKTLKTFYKETFNI